MKVGTILLTTDDCYVDEHGNLPLRPPGDKELLAGICKNTKVSPEGYAMLPTSIKQWCVRDEDYETPITIRELAEADLLLVSRSRVRLVGKKFRLDKFEEIFRTGRIEIWKHL